MSYPHRDFDNPEAETCWLSCLFQALWHSVVFHAAFDKDLAAPHYKTDSDEPLLEALQRTWAEYSVSEAWEGPLCPPAEKDDPQRVKSGGETLVNADDLARGFGQGYGDMSEALACLQQELSESPNPVANQLARWIVLVPLCAEPGSLPTPEMACEQVEQWQATNSALLAIDLTLPDPTPEISRRVAELWVPGSAAAVGSRADYLGPNQHRIVALVCYMWNIMHYVAFCRRQGDATRCLFFNDLPTLTHGAPRELAWHEVPTLCDKYKLSPRLVLFESLKIAEQTRKSSAAGP